MKVLIATPVLHKPPAIPRIYMRTLANIFALNGSHKRDFVQLCDGDASPNPIHAKYQRARHLALSGGYDALLCIESDMVIPPDALERLSALRAPVAYGLYCVRSGKHEWTAYTHLDYYGGVAISSRPDEARAAWGNVMEVAGIGQGCTLISREVLEAVPFRAAGGQICDHTFALDVQRVGFEQVCDLGVVCGHIDGNRVIWPEPNAPELYRIEAL